MINRLKRDKQVERADFVSVFEALDREILRIPWVIGSHLMNQPASVIKSSPIEERKEILRQSLPAFSGACSLIGHLKENQLHIAHSGDW
jgi:hypothetical protein